MTTEHTGETASAESLWSLARAVAMRLRWEAEHGAVGYPLTAQAPAVAVSAVPTEGASTQAMAEDLSSLRAAIGDCTRCPLHRGRTHLVFGEGNPRARLAFVGEGPDQDEDGSGRPLVGAAGLLLERIIVAMGLPREAVYICNVVKCRPPDNRTPEPLEQATCGPFLARQLELVRPAVIVALGATATSFLISAELSLDRARGTVYEWRGMKVVPTYPPAYLLHNPEAKRPVWEDMQVAQRLLGMPVGDNRRRT